MDPEIFLPGRVAPLVREDRLVGDLLDQARAEHRRGIRKITLRRASSRSKSGCASAASGRVGAARDREQVVHAAVRRAVGVLHEPRSRTGPSAR